VAVGDAYSDAATYRAVADKSDTSEDAEILTDLKAVSRWLDRELGRFFTKDATPVARFYRPDFGGDTLQIDDLATSGGPSSVTVDENDDGAVETLYATTDYEALPLNALRGSEVRPYTALRIPPWSPRSQWQAGRLVAVLGQWGWPNIPDAIARGTIHLTAILRLETSRSQSQVTEMGQVFGASIEARSIVKQLVQVYSKKVYAV
jgi:hypothetical protein